MQFLLTIAYLLLFCFIIYKAKAFYLTGISKTSLLLLFTLKCFAAILYYELHLGAIHGGDIFLYLHDSDVLFRVLKRSPADYIRLVFGPNAVDYPDRLSGPVNEMWHWSDWSAYFMVRFHGFIRLFSFGFPWVHGIFCAFVSFCGSWMLAKAIIISSRRINKHFVWILFCLPSILFWTSGYHKETVVTFAVGLFILSCFRLLKGRVSILTCLGLAIGALILFIVRDFFLYMIIPPLIALLFSIKWKRYSLLIFPVIYLILLSAGTKIQLEGKGGNYLQYIQSKQNDYLALKTDKAHFDPPQFDGSLISLLKVIPESALNGLFRPFPRDADSTLGKMAVAENIFILMIILFCFFRSNYLQSDLPYLLFIFCIGMSIIIASGLIVPNSGAILRYRSIGLFLIIPALWNLHTPYKL